MAGQGDDAVGFAPEVEGGDLVEGHEFGVHGVGAAHGFALPPLGHHVDQGVVELDAAVTVRRDGVDDVDQGDVLDGDAGFLVDFTQGGGEDGFA